MPRYCSTGGQPGLEGWTRETSSHVLQVTHRRGQHRLSGQAAHLLSQPCPWGLRSWEEFRARGLLGLAEELALGYDGPCLKRGMVHLGMPPRPQSGGTTAYHHPIVPNFSRAELWRPSVGPHNHCRATSCSAEAWAPTTQQHPCGQSKLFITSVRHPPSGLCVGHTDARTHPHTCTHLFTPKGLDSVL